MERNRRRLTATFFFAALISMSPSIANADQNFCVKLNEVIAMEDMKSLATGQFSEKARRLSGDDDVYGVASAQAINSEYTPCIIQLTRSTTLYSCKVAQRATYKTHDDAISAILKLIEPCLPNWKHIDSGEGSGIYSFYSGGSMVKPKFRIIVVFDQKLDSLIISRANPGYYILEKSDRLPPG